MAIKEVCRLCLKADEHELVWVFDKRFDSSDSMKDVIHVTTGVEITLKDLISQKICTKCCQVTVKMFEFRRTSQKNDKYLKEQWKLSLKDKEMKIPHTEVTIRTEPKKDEKNDDVEIKQESKPYKIHPTVRDLFKSYPQIKLPTVCLKYNIAPCVSMKMDQVEQYFKKHNMDFEEHTKQALRAGRVAAKRTSSFPPRAAPKNKILKPDETTSFKVKLHFNPSLEPTKKQRTNDEDHSEETEANKTNFVESLGLTAKPPETTTTELSFVENKSLPLHICEICNSVQYSAKDLRKHHHMHMRCQFCKLRLRTLESKQTHLANECPIKNMMNNLPNVVVQRAELNPWIRQTFPKAFEDFPPLNQEEQSVVPSEHSEVTEVIEILSDEEEQTIKNQEVTVTPPVSNIVYNTVSIVRPDIKIKGNDVLDGIDSRVTDIKVLKDLLTHYKPVNLFMDNHAQTELPHNKSITVHQGEMTGELRWLKTQLYVYKIPVELSKGQFKVKYDYNKSVKPPRRLNLWNDLTVLDVKPPNLVHVSNENVNPHSNVVVASKPLQTTSKFIRVNTNNLSPISTSNLDVSKNVILNQMLENVQSSSDASVKGTSMESAQQLGVIRVKNVWELT